MSIWNWADRIAAVPPAARLTLGEANTPLLRSRGIGPREGLSNLFFKYEGTNPSGSYKDRFAAAAVSRMLSEGHTICLASSSGNTGAALAAYCAAAGIRCRIAIVEAAPHGKTKQMLAYGAELFRVKGFGTDPRVTATTFAMLEEIAQWPGCALQISAYRYCPEAMTGCETISYELDEQLKDGVDHVFCPAGGGGLTLAIARGFLTVSTAGTPTSRPAVHCVQPAGNDTIASPLREGRDQARDVECTSKISGLQVANVIDGDDVIRACRETNGTGYVVSDEEAWNLQKRLTLEEGIFTEPAGAVAVAGAIRACRDGLLDRESTIVCLVTGSGFKDDASVDRMIADTDCPTIAPDELPERLTA